MPFVFSLLLCLASNYSSMLNKTSESRIPGLILSLRRASNVVRYIPSIYTELLGSFLHEGFLNSLQSLFCICLNNYLLIVAYVNVWIVFIDLHMFNCLCVAEIILTMSLNWIWFDLLPNQGILAFSVFVVIWFLSVSFVFMVIIYVDMYKFHISSLSKIFFCSFQPLQISLENLSFSPRVGKYYFDLLFLKM